MEKWKTSPAGAPLGSRAVHLRAPSQNHGRASGLWAIALGLLILLGSVAMGLDAATAFIVSGLAAALIYFYVRLYGEDRPGPRT